MLKTVIFFLFGCSLYFGQIIPTTGVPTAESATSTLDLKDGTRTTDTPGQGGHPSTMISLYNEPGGNSLRVSINPEDKKFESYIIVDQYGVVKKQGKTSVTNSCSIDISSLSSGNYWIQIEMVSPYEIASKKFLK